MEAAASRGAGGDAAEEPAAKRARADGAAASAPSGDPRTVVLLNVDGLASRLLAKDKASDAERVTAGKHAAALLTHLCAMAGSPPDVICLTEVRTLRRAQRRSANEVR